eukprot:284816368_3
MITGDNALTACHVRLDLEVYFINRYVPRHLLLPRIQHDTTTFPPAPVAQDVGMTPKLRSESCAAASGRLCLSRYQEASLGVDVTRWKAFP